VWLSPYSGTVMFHSTGEARIIYYEWVDVSIYPANRWGQYTVQPHVWWAAEQCSWKVWIISD
jgi:hypothetical protein